VSLTIQPIHTTQKHQTINGLSLIQIAEFGGPPRNSFVKMGEIGLVGLTRTNCDFYHSTAFSQPLLLVSCRFLFLPTVNRHNFPHTRDFFQRIPTRVPRHFSYARLYAVAYSSFRPSLTSIRPMQMTLLWRRYSDPCCLDS